MNADQKSSPLKNTDNTDRKRSPTQLFSFSVFI